MKFVFRVVRKIRRDALRASRVPAQAIASWRSFGETRGTQTPITFRMWFIQNVLGINKGPYWPVHFTSIVSGSYRNVYCGIETSPGYSPGCYIQAIGRIYVGDYTQIGPNVGIISSNHDVYDNRSHYSSEVIIGKYCWIGMNSVILPGVTLGDCTIVGAGSVVTKSFECGYCVIAGNPARKVRDLEPEKFVKHASEHEYNGYIRSPDFEHFRARNLRL